MFNWKKKIDDMKESEKQAKELTDKYEKDRLRKTQEQRWKKNFERFQKRFFCNFCKQPSQNVRLVKRMISPGASNDGLGGYEPTYEEVPDFNTPDDLWECKVCHNWTCKDHIHKGICQTCAEKM